MMTRRRLLAALALSGTALSGLPARAAHPQQQREGEAHQNEDRQQDHLNRHWNLPQAEVPARYSGRPPP